MLPYKREIINEPIKSPDRYRWRKGSIVSTGYSGPRIRRVPMRMTETIWLAPGTMILGKVISREDCDSAIKRIVNSAPPITFVGSGRMAGFSDPGRHARGMDLARRVIPPVDRWGRSAKTTECRDTESGHWHALHAAATKCAIMN